MAIETIMALSLEVTGKERHKIRATEEHLDSGTDIGTPTWWGHQIISSLIVVVLSTICIVTFILHNKIMLHW